MAYSYVPVDRDQPFLLPPDVRDWLSPGHMAWFVLEVVARLDTSALHARHANDGVGRRAYDPDMVLALMVYAYCTGQRSSRAMERLCEVDVAYRVICANNVPDHTTIARFRQGHEAVAVQMFTDVLELCAAAGLAKVGVVAVDGTKVGAQASTRANRTRAQIEAEVATMLGEAAAVDAAEDRLFGDARGDELPPELADPRSRGARLDAALESLKVREQQRQAVEAAACRARQELIDAAAERGANPEGRIPVGPHGVAEAQARLEASLARDADRHSAFVGRQARAHRGELSPARVGREPSQSTQTKRARVSLAKAKTAAERAAAAAEPERVNTSDPDSRLMKTPDGFAQAYNAQAAVNAQGVVLSAEVTQDANDSLQCEPMMAATRNTLDAAGVTEAIGTMLFDAGYCSDANLTAPGPDRLIATAKSHTLRRAAREHGWAHGDPPAGASPVEAMEHRLRTEEGAALYGIRQHTVEPVFGQIKDGRGFRRFVRRGLVAVDAEWMLITATHNVLKLFRASAPLAVTP
jgi:transposase